MHMTDLYIPEYFVSKCNVSPSTDAVHIITKGNPVLRYINPLIPSQQDYMTL